MKIWSSQTDPAGREILYGSRGKIALSDVCVVRYKRGVLSTQYVKGAPIACRHDDDENVRNCVQEPARVLSTQAW